MLNKHHPNIIPLSFSRFINIKHSQRTLLLQLVTGKDYEKYEKLLRCEVDIRTLTNDGGDELWSSVMLASSYVHVVTVLILF